MPYGGLNDRELIEAARRYAAGDRNAILSLSPTWTPSTGGLGSIPFFGRGGAGQAAARTLIPGGTMRGTMAGGFGNLSRYAVGFGALNPGTTPAPVLPGQGEYAANTPDFCSLITNVYARAACVAAAGLLGGGSGGNAGGSAACPPGYKSTPTGCQLEGMGPYLPGDVGQPDYVWTATNGRYGAGYTPYVRNRRHLACPPGFKLGKDEVCYECLTKKERKWNPGTKPFMTGGDLNAVARVRRLKKKGRRMVTTLGLTPARHTHKKKRK
jgi:hypothetical protein